MLLRAYALTTGLRKDRKVLTTVVVMTRQMNWGLGEEGCSCGRAAGRVLGVQAGSGDLETEVDEQRDGVPGSPTTLRKRS